ncbi:hypothetical protein HMPREF6745_2003 [Prevotella sp. oral taxon 472 str. F0295]|nr:hypothetical protein HMPREF6745_2003 [Prevotella sp. oral taxon 472 str. F0295]
MTPFRKTDTLKRNEVRRFLKSYKQQEKNQQDHFFINESKDLGTPR